MILDSVVLDTNVFVAAGFNEASHSAALVEAVRRGQLRLLWDELILRETKAVLKQIPPLDWTDYQDLFKPENLVPSSHSRATYPDIEDPKDQKFAALAGRTGAPLITNDDHFLSVRAGLNLTILTPREAHRHLQE